MKGNDLQHRVLLPAVHRSQVIQRHPDRPVAPFSELAGKGLARSRELPLQDVSENLQGGPCDLGLLGHLPALTWSLGNTRYPAELPTVCRAAIDICTCPVHMGPCVYKVLHMSTHAQPHCKHSHPPTYAQACQPAWLFLPHSCPLASFMDSSHGRGTSSPEVLKAP